jgi:hypothetical protein
MDPVSNAAKAVHGGALRDAFQRMTRLAADLPDRCDAESTAVCAYQAVFWLRGLLSEMRSVRKHNLREAHNRNIPLQFRYPVTDPDEPPPSFKCSIKVKDLKRYATVRIDSKDIAAAALVAIEIDTFLRRPSPRHRRLPGAPNDADILAFIFDGHSGREAARRFRLDHKSVRERMTRALAAIDDEFGVLCDTPQKGVRRFIIEAVFTRRRSALPKWVRTGSPKLRVGLSKELDWTKLWSADNPDVWKVVGPHVKDDGNALWVRREQKHIRTFIRHEPGGFQVNAFDTEDDLPLRSFVKERSPDVTTLIADFEAAGGKITVCEPGLALNYGEAEKDISYHSIWRGDVELRGNQIIRTSPPTAKAIPSRFSDAKNTGHFRRLGDTDSYWNELAFFLHGQFFDWAKYDSAGTTHPDVIAANTLVRLWRPLGEEEEEQDWEREEAYQTLVRSRSDGEHINWRVHELAADRLLAENPEPTTTKETWQAPPAKSSSDTHRHLTEALRGRGIVFDTLADDARSELEPELSPSDRDKELADTVRKLFEEAQQVYGGAGICLEVVNEDHR